MSIVENNQSATGHRGGKRAGSGRKLGAATKRTRKIADELMASGEKTPLEYMLEVMRQEVSPDLDPHRMLAAMTLRFEAAKAAAPYVHPRLQAIEHSGELKHSLSTELAALNGLK